MEDAKEEGSASHLFKWKDWDKKTFFSDFIKDGLVYNNKFDENQQCIMLFGAPSFSSNDSSSSFPSTGKFKLHDWPPSPESAMKRTILLPCRFGLMNGQSLPILLASGTPPKGLLEHWKTVLPQVPTPFFVETIHDDDVVYAIFPFEQIKNFVNDPDTHYHLAGKDAIPLVTKNTARLLPDTRTTRPCVAKTTHAMSGKGIFIIRNDKDEQEFIEYLQESGNNPHVVVEFVDIAHNLACYFFMHPSGEITWFGASEYRDSRFSTDAYVILEDQKKWREMQAPFVEEVVQYCKKLGFWGLCGVDVLFDSNGKGYLVDINPRVCASCPAVMAFGLLSERFGFTVGLYRSDGDSHFYGTGQDLLDKVTAYNKEHQGKSRVILHSFCPASDGHTLADVGVYGNDIEECKTVLNSFVTAKRDNYD